MSRFPIPAIESATGATADIYAQVKKVAGGRVPNTYAALGHLAPAALGALLNAQGVLAAASLNHQDIQTIKLLVSVHADCDVCMAAHSYVGKMTGLSAEALHAMRTGQATGNAKRDALVRFVSHLLTTSGTISQDEFIAIRTAGYGDTQLADISLAIALATLTSTFNRINATEVDFPS